MSTPLDKAGKPFWDLMWQEAELPAAADPDRTGLGNLFTKRLDRWYRRFFANRPTHGRSFLEVGCGSSIWLPYFATKFGFKIAGIDFSEEGCRKEELILAKAGAHGEIVCADFFDPPRDMLERFDYVYSAGVAEHFVPTSECIKAFSRFLKPGGIMITSVPNLSGLVGRLQKSINRSIYEIHVPLDNQALESAHANVGLKVLECDYFLSAGFGLMSVGGLDPALTSTKLKKQLIRTLEGLSVICWVIEENVVHLPETRLFSPYVICTAQKPN